MLQSTKWFYEENYSENWVQSKISWIYQYSTLFTPPSPLYPKNCKKCYEQIWKRLRYHSKTTYAKFSLMWHFLSPAMHLFVYVSGSIRCYFYGELSLRIKWMTPDESYIHCRYDQWACSIKLWRKRLHEFKSMGVWYPSLWHKWSK